MLINGGVFCLLLFQPVFINGLIVKE